MAIIRMTLEEIEKMMTPERIAEEAERAEKMPFVYDPDCPPLTEDQLKRFRRVKRESVG